MTIVEILVDRAIATYPTHADRIKRGAVLVVEGGVTLDEDGMATVSSNHHLYAVRAGHCPCMDVAKGNAPGGFCKHRWAVCLQRKLRAHEAWTAEDYVATCEGYHGVARPHRGDVWAFYPYTATGRVMRRAALIPQTLLVLGVPVLMVQETTSLLLWEEGTEAGTVTPCVGS